MSIRDLAWSDADFCVVDVETTGLAPRDDRIVELAVVRVSPGREPEVVLDSLVNPLRPVGATWVHGITDDDVAGAPTFSELLPALRRALGNAVLVGHNVYFDYRFITHEAAAAGQAFDLPHLCTMYMRPLVGLGERLSLEEACRAAGIPFESRHHARSDALATAQLLRVYLDGLMSSKVRTFADLARGKSYKFLKSFALPLLGGEPADGPVARMKPRIGGTHSGPVALLGPFRPPRAALPDARPIDLTPLPPLPAAQPETSAAADRTNGVAIDVEATSKGGPTGGQRALAAYLDHIATWLDDLDIDSSEVERARALRAELGISEGQARAVHARVFSAALQDMADDDEVDWVEEMRLKFLHQALGALGWAPGA